MSHIETFKPRLNPNKHSTYSTLASDLLDASTSIGQLTNLQDSTDLNDPNAPRHALRNESRICGCHQRPS